ncbi:MAG: ATP-binding protein [Bacteroidia bacterium]
MSITDCELIAFDGRLLFSDKIMDSKISLSIFKGLVSYVIGYLDEEYVYATENIIKKGEGVTIEFKESMSKIGKPDIIKTICAFLNTRGGTILLGINDASRVVGIKVGSLKEIDNYKQSIIQLIRDKVGAPFTTNIHFNTEKIDNKILLRINCIPSGVPAILEDNGLQFFYMRSGPANIQAPNIKEVISYYKKRFESVKN